MPRLGAVDLDLLPPCLMATLSAQDLRQERARLRRKIDVALSNDGDALSAYDELARWMAEKQPGEKQRLLALLKEATSAFKNDPEYQNNLQYLKLWSFYATKVDKPLAVYDYLMKKGIGLAWAELYDEYATLLERAGE
jgi:checkpoint serine/threonine-protein kinase